jgi:hypothetical protein
MPKAIEKVRVDGGTGESLVHAPATAWEEDVPVPSRATAVTVRVLIVGEGRDGVGWLADWGADTHIEKVLARSVGEAIKVVRQSRPDWILLDAETQSQCGAEAAGIPLQVMAGAAAEAVDPKQVREAVAVEAKVRYLAAAVVRHALRRKRTESATPAPGSKRLRERAPEAFARMAAVYGETLDAYVRSLPHGSQGHNSETAVQAIVRRLEELRARPKDVVEVHLFAMRALLDQATPQSSRIYFREGQTLLLKVMGYLANRYLQASMEHSHEMRVAMPAAALRGKRRNRARNS